VEVPRAQVFESVKAAGRVIEDYAASVIFSPVGTGASALGETPSSSTLRGFVSVWFAGGIRRDDVPGGGTRFER
jgi:hypothetical protein